MPFPLLVGLVADPESVAQKVQYRYSGGRDVASCETPAQKSIRDYLNRSLGTTFNATLVNAYGYHYPTPGQLEAKNGDNASIGRHSDDEKDIIVNNSGTPMVGGISWIPRDSDHWMLRIRSKKPLRGDGKKSKYKIVNLRLRHHEVFVMCGVRFQQDWTHEIPKSQKRWPHPGQRVSFTMRHLRPPVLTTTRKRKRVSPTVPNNSK